MLKRSTSSLHLRLEYWFCGLLREAGVLFSLSRQSYYELVVGHHGGSASSRELEEFVKSSRVGNKAFIVHRCANKCGQFLAVAKYGVAWRGLVVIPEGRGSRELLDFALELRKFLECFQLNRALRVREAFRGYQPRSLVV